ncbi:DUF4917 family protein [Pseudomonas sp. GM80]|uniref:DUF4917 family protein n=1 Tax=Pseudomonas sp. GM80 TaxID=1144339 RepID=UPI00026F95B7|nr:DUF4917 family protein [Pseudomonas sp. GM80]EJN18690.1 hypothetical protein PMI37_05720 [Pseudomonas sp. GM80]
MRRLGVDSALLDWGEIAGDEWNGLLLGNGFSINIWSEFNYPSLFSVAQRVGLRPHLVRETLALFEHLRSSNFEDVLRVLYHSHLVDHQLGSPQVEQIEGLYSNTKNSLSAAVNFAHVPPDFRGLNRLNATLSEYRDIFTTNYDLIPYWAIMRDSRDFRDFFWGGDNSFDLSDVHVRSDKTVIYYLHGAVHLVEKPDGTTKKLVGAGFERLSDLFDLDHPEQIPLMISEGSSSSKYIRIRRNDYLRFCYEELCCLEGNLVVLGHSLHRDYDQHIIDALKRSNIERIAVSVWPGMSEIDIITFKARISRELPDKDLYFFDSETHPLADPDSNVDGDY